MKRFAIVLGIVLCFSPVVPGQQAGKQAEPPARVPVAGSSRSTPALLEKIIRRAWQDWKEKNRQAFSKILAEDAIEVEADGKGPRDKQATLADMEGMTLDRYALENFKFQPLGASAEMATYKCTVDITAGGEKIHAALAVVEVWVKRGNDWKLLHYQETEIK